MELGRYATITILYPPPVSVPSFDAPSTDANARSLVLRIECVGFSFLVAGDADSATEERLIEDGPIASVDLLRIFHHGSAYSTTEEFLDAFSPQIAVVSVGPNLYGHPSPKTLDRLSQAGCRIFRTDLEGAVVVRVRKSIARILEWNRKGNE
jgi:competence protein ComEC